MTRRSDDKMLCYCKGKNYGDVRASIAKLEARRIEQVMSDCDTGTGCRSCHPEIQELIDERREELVSTQPEGWLKGLWRRLWSRS